MANSKPPAHAPGAPAIVSLPAGTVLYRVHDEKHGPDAFNAEPSHRYYGGGRFDSTGDDLYPFMYAGESVDVAIAETLLRDLLFDGSGTFRLPGEKICGRRLSAVVTRADLPLVSLRTGADLRAVCQDTWLTTCDPPWYAQTRHWGHWIRARAPSAAGYVWMSHREPTQQAYVLFGDPDRTPPGAIEPTADPEVPEGAEARFDDPLGRRSLMRRLRTYNVALRPR